MDEKDIIKRLNSTISHITPDNIDKILLECEKVKGKDIKMKKTENKFRVWTKNLSYMFGGVVLALLVVFGANQISINKVDSIIALDVNPSVELEVNKDEKVLKAQSLNNEGKKVLSEMDLKGSNLDVAVNAIIGSMVKNGFITDLSNSILVSVENNDKEKGQEIQTKVSNEIDAILKGSNIEGAILSQTVEHKTELEKQAEEYDITIGKAQLINEIISKNNTLHFDDLAKMTINELNLIQESKPEKVENVSTTGSASKKAYIGEDKAKEIALKHAGTNEKSIYDLELDFDSEKGVLVYEIEFQTKFNEFEYEINATTGEIVKSRKEANNDYEEDVREGEVPASITSTSSNNSSSSNKNTSSSNKNNTTTSNTSSTISKSEAKSIALKRAGVSSNSIRDYEIELDTDDGVKKYEISFNVGNTEYDIDVNAQTGKVIKFDKEIDD